MPRKKTTATERPNETLGKRIARLRKERAITQVELAAILGIAQPNVSDYERDESKPGPEAILKMAEAFKVSADELLGRKSPAVQTPVVSRKLMRRVIEIEKLPKRDQQALIRTIDAFLKNAST